MARLIEYSSTGMIVSALVALVMVLVPAAPGTAAADEPGPKDSLQHGGGPGERSGP